MHYGNHREVPLDAQGRKVLTLDTGLWENFRQRSFDNYIRAPIEQSQEAKMVDGRGPTYQQTENAVVGTVIDHGTHLEPSPPCARVETEELQTLGLCRPVGRKPMLSLT